MMPTNPTVSSAVYVSLLVHQGTRYEPDCWLGASGEAHGSLRYDRDRLSFTVQGRPAGLRELAAALIATAELVERTFPHHAAEVEVGEVVG
jgi:hypothetical protein